MSSTDIKPVEFPKDIHQTAYLDNPDTGTETSQRIIHKINTLIPDLSAKDIGKWMNAWQIAVNPVYPNRYLLYDYYTYILGHDAYLCGLIEKRQKPVLNKTLLYKDNGQKVDAMDKLIRSRKFKDMMKELLDALQWGLAGMEFVPGREFDFRLVPKKHIKPKWQRITENQAGIDGWDYTKYWNLWVIDTGSLGMLQQCARAAAFKKDAMADWAELIEIFGRPTQVMWYDAFNPQVLAEMDGILKNAGSALRIKLPKGTEYEQFDVKGGNSTGDLQMQFIDICNKEMAVTQLGSTETTGTSKGGGYAQSDVHYQQQKELMKSDMDFICDLLNSEKFIRILKSYGLPVTETGAFEFDREVDIDYIQKYTTIIANAQKLGVPMSKDFVYETLAIPQPKEGQEILEPMHTEPDGDEEPGGKQPDGDGDEPKPKKKKKAAAPKQQAEEAEAPELSDMSVWEFVKQKFYKRFFGKAPR